MFESIYNGLLFVLAIVGALRAGAWIIGRRWHWGWKAVALLLSTGAVIGFAQQIAGGLPAMDLRAVTIVLATAGCIFALEFGFRRVRNPWARFGFVGLAGIFLFLTWSPTIDHVMSTASTVTVPTAAAPIQPSTMPSTPATPAAASAQPAHSPTRKELCDQGKVDYGTCHDWGYK